MLIPEVWPLPYRTITCGAARYDSGAMKHSFAIGASSSGALERSGSGDHFLVGFTLVVRTHLDSHFSIKPPQEIQQFVGGEATEVSVHQRGHVGLPNAQNTCDFTLFQSFLFQDSEDVKSYLRTSHELVSVLQTQIGKNVSYPALDSS